MAVMSRPPLRLGCVSFLNAKPLIDGIDRAAPDVRVRYDVPSALLDDLQTGAVDIALCPVIDYQVSTTPLAVVPVGGIGCCGPTLTVRVFSRVPFEQVSTIAGDTDSHTSVTLARVIMKRRFDRDVSVAPFDASADAPAAETVLLIGDKVVAAGPPRDDYGYELDLGEAWYDLTGGPFVFAVWMARRGAELADLPTTLDTLRRDNAGRISQIVDTHAADLGWPDELARRYLGRMLRYEVGPPQLAAIEQFWRDAADVGAIESVRPLESIEPAAT